MEPLESDAVPSHAPVIVADAVEFGAVGIDDAALPPHAAIATVPARRITVHTRMMSLLALTSLIIEMRKYWIGDSVPVAGRPSQTNVKTLAARSTPKRGRRGRPRNRRVETVCLCGCATFVRQCGKSGSPLRKTPESRERGIENAWKHLEHIHLVEWHALCGKI
jgi:hypothetical protein